MKRGKKHSSKPRMPYYRAYPRDFFEGTTGLSFEAKGAYRLVIDLIYMHQGKLHDEARYIAGHLGCSVRKWNSLRQQLADAGKILIRNNTITNPRSDAEIAIISGLSSDETEIISGLPQDNLAEKDHETSENNDLTDFHARATKTNNQNQIQKEEIYQTNTQPIEAAREPKLLDKCLVAYGLDDLNSAPPSLLSIGPIYDLITRGYDLEMDILPAIRGSSRKFTSWNYIVKAVVARVKEREKIPEKAKPKPIDWPRWVEAFKLGGIWKDELGPKPGEPGCLVPPEFLGEIEQEGSAT